MGINTNIYISVLQELDGIDVVMYFCFTGTCW